MLLLLPLTTVMAKTYETTLPRLYFAEGTASITGTVIDSMGQKPVDYATVSIFNQASGKLIPRSLTGTDGKFSIGKLSSGVYRLKISFLSYANKTTFNLKVDEGISLKLGRILLSPDKKILKEVQVTAQKALIEEKIDHTVYNAENDLTTRGGDATDVMKRVPMPEH